MSEEQERTPYDIIDSPDGDWIQGEIDIARRAAFDKAIAIGKDYHALSAAAWLNKYGKAETVADALIAARDSTEKPRSDKGKHHHVAGVLQEDVDEAEN